MKKVILFVVTNGAGLGHLTRGLAVARRIRALNPEFEIIFLSTSLALEVIRDEGFMFYYIPTKGIMPEAITPSLWNNYLKSHLKEIVQFHQPCAMVFDGAYPYGAVVGNIKMASKMKSFWIKRETYKEELDKSLKLEEYFDHIIVPKEAGKEYLREREGRRWYCHPIIYLNREEAYPRNELRRAWQVKEGEQIVYVQLGAGNINDIGEDINCVLEGILQDQRYRVILGESIIGKSLGVRKARVSVIREYPNSRYFKGIDFAVSAVGYNSYHELMYFKVPTLFIPNRQTVKDDQRARALLAANTGAAICLDHVTLDNIAGGMNYMGRRREQMKMRCEDIIVKNGAEDVARFIMGNL